MNVNFHYLRPACELNSGIYGLSRGHSKVQIQLLSALACGHVLFVGGLEISKC